MSKKSNTDINELHKNDNVDHDINSTKIDNSVDEEWKQAQGGSDNDALKELQAKYDELDDQYKRLWADQQNMVSRFQRERQENLKYAAVPTIEAILPALDNFEFAKKSLNKETQFADVIKSIDMLKEQFMMSLKSIGLEEVNTSIKFNPELHEAVSNVQDAEKEEGTIVEVLKKGFKLKDKVLRVATVVVTTKE